MHVNQLLAGLAAYETWEVIFRGLRDGGRDITINLKGVWLHLQGWIIISPEGVTPHPSVGYAVAP